MTYHSFDQNVFLDCLATIIFFLFWLEKHFSQLL